MTLVFDFISVFVNIVRVYLVSEVKKIHFHVNTFLCRQYSIPNGIHTNTHFLSR